MKTEIIDKFTVLITSAFGFVAALAWNEAVKNLLEKLNLQRFGPWVYAVFVTMIAVAAAVWLGKLSEKAKRLSKRR